MKAYLDASVLVSLFCTDAHTDRARLAPEPAWPGLLARDIAAAEFPVAIARRVRMDDPTRDEAVAIVSAFDEWLGEVCHQVLVTPSDLASASICIHGLDSPLRAPDAFHVRASARPDAAFVTLDAGMANAARALPPPVVLP